MQSSSHLESHKIEVPNFTWQDKLGQLWIWIATTNAYQKKDSSLDYRLRDASHIKSQVIRQLDRLQQVLEDLQLALEEPFLEKTFSSDSSETEDDEPGKGIQSIYLNLVDSINSLYQMSILPLDQPSV